MKLQRIRIQNFRAFEDFTLDLAGESLFLVGENGCGKSTLLTAIARSLGVHDGFLESDFGDSAKPIEIISY